MNSELTSALIKTRRFFKNNELISPDERTLTKVGGRSGDAFYRDRWSHDKVVRSTHGVNCTGSCSWNVYVKDGLITWETQAVDYPTTGPDKPEYEPRGCPRGASFSWYTYSPTRTRYPYIRGVLLEMYREARERLGDPVLAWADITDDPNRTRRYKRARGKGGLVRAHWDEAIEIVAAAHVHTIRKWGPDRVAGFSPIPAMSMISHASGARFVNLIGGSMLSFYDWYADMPVASPQVFGDQTDVPESGDWWDSTYLMIWGTNVPVTRTPDAHWMTEARYRGQKVVVVSPDFADSTKFADEWMPAEPGTDGALAMAMGHVTLKEFFVDRQTPYFTDYVKAYTDLPFLVTLDEARDEAGATTHTAGKFLTASDLTHEITPEADNAEFKTVLIDAATNRLTVPPGTLGHRYGESDAGRWNLDLGDIDPQLTLIDSADETVAVDMPRFDAGQGAPGVVRRGVPARRVAGRLVTTVFDLLLAQYGVGRPGLPGQWPTGYDDASSPYTPAWQARITGVTAEAAERIGREFAQTAADSRGRSMILMG
ncbi:MAG: molybdopterin-dependent oxidoreductase, partial [Tomitella sp.]|nr:molybdopterin-dependent oxidoreductase [Tomitella sp.]